jgi:hypothetical protein
MPPATTTLVVADSETVRETTGVVDRRRVSREPLEVPVLVDSLRAWETCQTSDISSGGVAIHSERDWGASALVDLYFELPGGFAIDAKAEFLGSQDGVARFRFVELGPPARSAIQLHMQATQHSGARIVHVG